MSASGRRRKNSGYPPKVSARRRRVIYLARQGRWVALAILLAGGLYAGDRLKLFGQAWEWLAQPRAPGQDEARYDGATVHVGRVIDGDTIDVNVPDGKETHTRIRLWGVDTPETKAPRRPVQHFGPEAEAFTREACQGKDVRLELVRGNTRDKYKRLLAYVWLPDGKMLNRELVRLGYAYADPRFPHRLRTEFRNQERSAADARIGLWRDVRAEGLPYYYKKPSPGGMRPGR